MSADRELVDRLLASISDGSPVDWEAARDRAGPAERERLDIARDMERIAEFHRGLQREPGPAPAPERWGELLLLERIGSGARADVYRAWDATLQREVALKLMRSHDHDAALLEEGRAAARVRHPHVVTVHGIAKHEGRVGLWMELVRGATLEHDARTRGPLGGAEARRCAAEIGSGLAAVHEARLLHRDVTPANIVRDAQGRFVLADFGLGLRDDDAARAESLSGTPMYMAPEVLAGSPASERSDQYGLGLVLWFALTGRHPFEATTLPELIAAAKRGPIRPAGDPGGDAALWKIVERAIAPDPAARFPNVRAMVAALESAGADSPAIARGAAPGARATVLWVAVLGIGIAIAAGLAWRTARVHAPPAPGATGAPATPASSGYSVGATLLRRTSGGAIPLVTGDRVRPGDRLSLEVRASLPAWTYVLDEDEHGERYLLFPQPSFDLHNPLAADSAIVLPGPLGGRENAWTVTSAGGREHFLVVVSPEPIAEIEADLARLPAARPGRLVTYAPVGDAAVERLRGVGGVAPLPATASAPRPSGFDAFRALAGRESAVRGVWVRQIVLENPAR